MTKRRFVVVFEIDGSELSFAEHQKIEWDKWARAWISDDPESPRWAVQKILSRLQEDLVRWIASPD